MYGQSDLAENLMKSNSQPNRSAHTYELASSQSQVKRASKLKYLSIR